jgi:hypothetical protein
MCVLSLKKVKGILITGNGDTLASETSRFTHFLDNRLTDDGEVSLKRRQIADTWYSFLLEAESTPGP